VSAVRDWQTSGAGSLKDALAVRLPGLARAMDEQWARAQLERMLPDTSTSVGHAQVASLFYRDDGSCTFRYRVHIDDGTAGGRPQTVLGRVCRGADAVNRYLKEAVLPLAASAATAVPSPWRVLAAKTAEPSVALHVFPIDPELPTLGKALELARVADMLGRRCGAQPSSVVVVRHSRRGSCVLRYDAGEGGQTATGSVKPVAFGKVYGDGTGATAYEFLRSVDGPLQLHWQSARSDTAGWVPVNLPKPLAFDARCRFLLTDVVRGESTVSSVLAARLTDRATPWSEGGHLLGVTELLTSCGGALATLHERRGGKAPIRQPGDAVSELRCELDTVSRIWPRVAQQVRGYVQEAMGELSSPVTAVLCHGDYTPSQALSSGGQVTGLVDFDAVCWADPASDLGRFLAHLDLLVTKYSHARSPQITAALAASFIRGYHEGSGAKVHGERSLLRRVAAYRALSLAMTALHACRQLKDRRLSLALSMLQTADHWTGKVVP
jgi:aminoglycoside phosphotransferase (APT) family kinase protein